MTDHPLPRRARIRLRPSGYTLLRLAGSLLLAAGLLVAGFVAYQLWVTGLFARHAQGGLQIRLEERAATVVVALAPYLPDSALPEAPISAGPGLADPEEIDLEAALAQAGLPAASPPAGPGMLATEPVPPAGDALGRIVIPSAEVDWTVVEGVSVADLRRGAGHMPGTALPGQPGNAVISGHRTTYGAPFSHLDRLVPGDLITVTTVAGTHAYQVVETMVVRPSEVWVTEQWQGAWLTLTTCNPRYSSRERLVVVARLVGGPNAVTLLGEEA